MEPGCDSIDVEDPPVKKYVVHLSGQQRRELEELIRTGTQSARVLSHARILLKVDAGEFGPGWTDAAAAAGLEVDSLTVSRARQRFVEGGLNRALHRKHQENRPARRLDGAGEAHLIALVCGRPPEGRTRWTLRLLADRMVELGHVDELSHETVRKVLKRGISSRGSGTTGVSRPTRTASS